MTAWLKGGHPERRGAVATLLVFAVSYLTHGQRVNGFYVGVAVLDLVMTAFFVWMALTCDRWWLLVMSGVMGLTLMVYVTALLVPSLGPYASISARVGLGLLTMLTLLAGAGERWLAGEAAVSGAARWRPRRKAS